MAGFTAAIRDRRHPVQIAVPELLRSRDWRSRCAVGSLDDIVDLCPRYKLILELAAICILGGWGPQLDLLPYHPLNIALTIFWLITATNAFNLIDGIDGLRRESELSRR